MYKRGPAAAFGQYNLLMSTMRANPPFLTRTTENRLNKMLPAAQVTKLLKYLKDVRKFLQRNFSRRLCGFA